MDMSLDVVIPSDEAQAVVEPSASRDHPQSLGHFHSAANTIEVRLPVPYSEVM